MKINCWMVSQYGDDGIQVERTLVRTKEAVSAIVTKHCGQLAPAEKSVMGRFMEGRANEEGVILLCRATIIPGHAED